MAPERLMSRAAEDKLTFRLGMVARERCHDLIDAYNQCARGRTISIIWACKGAYNASQDCIRKYVTDDNVETMKARWLAAGKPTKPDWDKLMEGLIND